MFDDAWSMEDLMGDARQKAKLYDPAFWTNPGGGGSQPGAGGSQPGAGGKKIDQQNALLGVIMGEGSIGGMIGGGIGGAIGQAPGAVVGSMVGRALEAIGREVVTAGGRGYSQADISSYAPPGGGVHQTGIGGGALPDKMVGLLAEMNRNIEQITKAGISTKPERQPKL